MKKDNPFKTSFDLFAIHSRSPIFSRYLIVTYIISCLNLQNFTSTSLYLPPFPSIILIVSSRTFCQQYRETYQMHRLIPLSDLTTPLTSVRNKCASSKFSLSLTFSLKSILFISSFQVRINDKDTRSLMISSILIHYTTYRSPFN